MTSLIPKYYKEFANITIPTTKAEENYYAALADIDNLEEEEKPDKMALVGARLGGGFENTLELHVMKCKQAMKN